MRELHREGGGDVACGLVSLHMKGELLGQSFAFSRSQLTPGGVVPLWSAKPHMSKHQVQKPENVVNTDWNDLLFIPAVTDGQAACQGIRP